MMLKSRILRGDPLLEACLVRDSAHITPGSHGNHVAKIQAVIAYLDNIEILDKEVQAKYYGPSTAAAVLNYKKKRNIINPAYQTQADNIVGKMTIQRLDEEILSRQEPTPPRTLPPCRIDAAPRPDVYHIGAFFASRR